MYNNSEIENMADIILVQLDYENKTNVDVENYDNMEWINLRHQYEVFLLSR